MLHNAMGVSDFAENSVTKVYGSTLLSLQGWMGVKFPGKKLYVTLHWPLTCSATYGQNDLECMRGDSPCETYGSDLALSHLGHCPSPCQQIPVR